MTFAARRQKLLSQLSRPLLLAAGKPPPRNYPANTFPFRPDSTFLYFFEGAEAGSMALFEPASKTVTLFLPQRSVEEALWHGALESFSDAVKRHQVDAVLEVETIEAELKRRGVFGRLDAVAVADFEATAFLAQVSQQPLSFSNPTQVASLQVREAIAGLRLRKSDEELEAMRRTAQVTRAAHLAAMQHTQVGGTEQQLCAQVESVFAQHGCSPAYQTILSVRGEVLHNHGHDNVLRSGDIVLLDGGAEDKHSGYCSDVTRCWPVDLQFTPQARDIYELVLASQLKAIDAVKPGVRFRDLHRISCQVLAQGLVDLGLLVGSADSLVEQGAHAVFFPHGLGHQIGLDVHDLEAFGDEIHYPRGASRSTQFGVSFLRMDMVIEAGMTFTVEPGLYFVPAIVNSPDFRNRFKGSVAFEKAEGYLAMNEGRGFGGIRIEDDVHCRDSGAEVLTAHIAKTVAELAAVRAA